MISYLPLISAGGRTDHATGGQRRSTRHPRLRDFAIHRITLVCRPTTDTGALHDPRAGDDAERAMRSERRHIDWSLATMQSAAMRRSAIGLPPATMQKAAMRRAGVLTTAGDDAESAWMRGAAPLTDGLLIVQSDSAVEVDHELAGAARRHRAVRRAGTHPNIHTPAASHRAGTAECSRRWP